MNHLIVDLLPYELPTLSAQSLCSQRWFAEGSACPAALTTAYQNRQTVAALCSGPRMPTPSSSLWPGHASALPNALHDTPHQVRRVPMVNYSCTHSQPQHWSASRSGHFITDSPTWHSAGWATETIWKQRALADPCAHGNEAHCTELRGFSVSQPFASGHDQFLQPQYTLDTTESKLVTVWQDKPVQMLENGLSKSTVNWKQYYRNPTRYRRKPFLARNKNCSLIRDVQNKLPFMQDQQFIDMLTGKSVSSLLQNSFIYTQGNMHVYVYICVCKHTHICMEATTTLSQRGRGTKMQLLIFKAV
jgi:hypothetical protein